MKLFLKIAFLFVFLVNQILITKAEELKMIVNLSGMWRFQPGDDMKYAEPKYDDSEWDKIYVPSSWEKEGYVGLNGFGWYRKTFFMPIINHNELVYVYFENIDDVDEVYFNGVKIGASGTFPPDEKTGYGKIRKYPIPPHALKLNTDNVISVRTYDISSWGGIVNGPVTICIDEDNSLLEFNLCGNWKFMIGDYKDWKLPEYNDNEWDDLIVPGYWDVKYAGHDGFGWYRKTFTLPDNSYSQDLYLVLGKVDDEDHVYINGIFIGSVSDIIERSAHFDNPREHTIRRYYKVRDGVLQFGQENVIAVRVYDKGGSGGIYEGPVGFMTGENLARYMSKHRYERNIIEEIFQFIIPYFD